MAGEIFGAGVLGLVAILILGGFLALAAVFLPRLLMLGEVRGEGKWGLGALGASPLEPRAPAAPRVEERAGTVLPPREPLAARMGAAAEDNLLAAAIALGLSLYQQEHSPQPKRVPLSSGGSPWGLSGRLQAMQARINRQRRG